jgi:GNAT superfamily N-acetyltransferase
VTSAWRIEKLNRAHAVEEFRCGQADLDRFLVRHALQAQRANSSQTYVALQGDSVAGYYTFVVGQAEAADAPARVTEGMPRHPIPLLILARLAVCLDWQGRGIGAGLLRDALRRTLQVADIAGVRALTVHAKDEAAGSFYRHFGFTAAPTDDRHLFLLIKDIVAAAGG